LLASTSLHELTNLLKFRQIAAAVVRGRKGRGAGKAKEGTGRRPGPRKRDAPRRPADFIAAEKERVPVTEPVAVSRVRSRWIEGPRSAVLVRRFAPILIDEPTADGGHDTAPRPTEYLLAGLAGCTGVIAERVAREMGFVYTGLECEYRGALDPRGIRGLPGYDPHFHTVTGTVRVTTAESDGRLQALAAEVERRCPLYQTISRAGARMEVEWVRAEP
jgi:uncharacterized OsmC-like protein